MKLFPAPKEPFHLFLTRLAVVGFVNVVCCYAIIRALAAIMSRLTEQKTLHSKQVEVIVEIRRQRKSSIGRLACWSICATEIFRQQSERKPTKGLIRGIGGSYAVRALQIGVPEGQEQKWATYVVGPHPSD